MNHVGVGCPGRSRWLPDVVAGLHAFLPMTTPSTVSRRPSVVVGLHRVGDRPGPAGLVRWLRARESSRPGRRAATALSNARHGHPHLALRTLLPSVWGRLPEGCV